jgi:hypothetical protein
MQVLLRILLNDVCASTVVIELIVIVDFFLIEKEYGYVVAIQIYR